MRTRKNFTNPNLTQDEYGIFIQTWQTSNSVTQVVERLDSHDTFPLGTFGVLYESLYNQNSRLYRSPKIHTRDFNSWTGQSRGTGWASRTANELRANNVRLKKLPNVYHEKPEIDYESLKIVARGY